MSSIRGHATHCLCIPGAAAKGQLPIIRVSSSRDKQSTPYMRTATTILHVLHLKPGGKPRIGKHCTIGVRREPSIGRPYVVNDGREKIASRHYARTTIRRYYVVQRGQEINFRRCSGDKHGRETNVFGQYDVECGWNNINGRYCAVKGGRETPIRGYYPFCITVGNGVGTKNRRPCRI